MVAKVIKMIIFFLGNKRKIIALILPALSFLAILINILALSFSNFCALVLALGPRLVWSYFLHKP